MGPLPADLRRVLENAVVAARESAEKAATAAIDVLAVEADRPFASLSEGQRGLRNALRARARALGEGSLRQGIRPVEEEIAYEQWHRMLFARFLAENQLLMHPTAGVPVTLEECAELASEGGEADEWMVAAKYASAMLPGIFRRDDPSAQVRFAPDDRQTLEKILRDLPSVVFTSDDALGWVYQFWQSEAKDEVSRSGRKIGENELASVTQFFTEHYMVRFLLENSLGAWWAGRHPDSRLLKEWEYLRFDEDGTPAAGMFDGWPKTAAEVTVMDPCCGSGHFLVTAADMLRKMRMEEEGLSEQEAADSVLRDNLFGLEIDPRCTQLAAFALALDAWKRGGYRPIPLPSVACSGIRVGGDVEEWRKLAGDDTNLQATLERLYRLFKNAPHLGSLINPAAVDGKYPLLGQDSALVAVLVEKALSRGSQDPTAAVFGAVAEGAARAGELLSRKYVLVATNVPYLLGGKQSDPLRDYVSRAYPHAKRNLATAFIERCREFQFPRGTSVLVTPQNWLQIGSYGDLRRRFITHQTLRVLALLGEEAFETFGNRGPRVVLLVTSNTRSTDSDAFFGINASSPPGKRQVSIPAKIVELRTGKLWKSSVHGQLGNPDHRISFQVEQGGTLLSSYSKAVHGLTTGDGPRLIRKFWELPVIRGPWVKYQTSVPATAPYGGFELLLNWNDGNVPIQELPGFRRDGIKAWGRNGVAVTQMRHLPVSLYMGDAFDISTAVILPDDDELLPAIFAFCASPEFYSAVRAIDESLYVTTGTLVKVPFDLERWRRIAAERGPLPAPYSNAPTQWLFTGSVAGSQAPLQSSVARLIGYRWPAQRTDALDELADEDGIVCVPSVAGEKAGPERLRALLAAAYGDEWSAATVDHLLADAGSPGKSLEQWLRDDFFVQHCRLFYSRPFIWQIWDGRRDGFSALVNYHKLTHANLQKLTYTHLGWWIDVQRNARNAGEAGADARLAAAIELQKKLELILEGQPPYDIYVRWEPLHEQPIGWNPDLDDGVRLNIRPFVTAGVLRSKFTVNWNKDRGTNLEGSERLNDRHYSIAEKQEARRRAGRA